MTRERIERSPEVDLRGPVSEWDLEGMHAYYEWPWHSATGGDTPAAGRTGELRLQSAREVLGFQVEARDGQAGEVQDFLFSIVDWTIDYVVIDTGAALPGREVAVAASWIKDIQPSASTAYLDLKRETVEESPEYDPVEFVGHEA